MTTPRHTPPPWIYLCGPHDPFSFLLPVFGFKERHLAHLYQGSESYKRETNIIVPYPVYPVIELPSGHTYVIREEPEYADFRSDKFLPLSPTSGGPQTYTTRIYLRFGVEPMPLPETYNAVIMVAGKRGYKREPHPKSLQPPWWNYVTMGERECFVAWGPSPNSPKPLMQIPVDPDRPDLQFSVARSGYGVLFAREWRFNKDARPSLEQTSVVLVSFQTRDSNPRQDHTIEIEVRNISDWGQADHSSLGEHWLRLIARGEEGFNTYCRSIPQEEEDRRLNFLTQVERLRSQGDGFRRMVSDLDWTKALDQVNEAWQLNCVVAVHCDARFDQPGQTHYSRSGRLAAMLQSHKCEEAGRTALLGMVDFLSVRDRDWYVQKEVPPPSSFGGGL